MRRLLFASLILTVTINAFSQSFTLEETFQNGLRSGSISWGDINNDGNLDFIQTGNDIDATATTRLFINTGSTFELLNTDLPNIFEGASDWGDYDNDGDLDLLLAGSGTDGLLTRLYDNIEGELILNGAVSLHGIDRGSVEWGDYDADGDLDLLISGQDGESGSVTKIYNNENGTFTEVETSLTGVSFGIASWVDFDGDGDLDVMLSGFTSTGPKVSELYENTGTTFSLVFEDSFKGLSESSLDFGDYDNDGDLDFLVAGFTNSNTSFTAIYQNNGSSFDIVFEGSLPNVIEGTVLWGDSDNDGDLDIFITGNTVSATDKIAQLYSNNGSGFDLESSFDEAGQSAAAFADYDSDGDLDIFISGQRNDFTIYSGIYVNENSNEIQASNANIKPIPPSGLTSQIENDAVVLSWDLASDNSTPQDALTYALFVRSESDTLVNPSSLSDGKRKLVKRGNSGSSNSFNFNYELDPGDYFWSVQSIDNAFEGSSFVDEELFHINFPPVISGTSSSLATPEETSLLIEIQDLEIDDPDNEFPSDFTLTVLEGANYTFTNNEITPELDFNGMLSVPVLVNDGTDDSEIAEIAIEVTPVNDPPVITGSNVTYSTPEETNLTIDINDLIVQDPDNKFPTDFSLEIGEGDNYTQSNNVITPDNGFVGVINVPITVNDGTDSSEPFDLMVEVMQVLGLDKDFIQDNFAVYPNPTTDYVIIQPNETSIAYDLAIYDINGILLFADKILTNRKKEIDLRKFSIGLYLLKISSESKVGTMTILKE
ncbi:FG-GAP-like repeat-containing protein [Marivirga harenae]|uniref:FG-GAP-like repeat-containing protein n=1 Tax=Marivirga harenae TaxID=2010992 RepID=UPI0026DF382C|nr:FG-GAP-like repeat-containing protein [Marivirga harenae]WKV13343.1 FG-GAP-like repeat-containing protein [Marivirga harenae]|tara:strand:+ start:164698 stop:167007 length:2310 start_codon:yes stop_codon:yes gene_type:complete